MSLETDQGYAEALAQENELAEKNERAEKAKAIKKALEAGKPFKDLLLNKDAEWEAVKKEIALFVYGLPAIGNDMITKDFLAGIRYCTELIDGRCQEFNTAFEAMGKE